MALSGLDRSRVDSVKCITLHLHPVLAGKEGAASSKQQGRINVFPGAAHHSLCRLPVFEDRLDNHTDSGTAFQGNGSTTEAGRWR